MCDTGTLHYLSPVSPSARLCLCCYGAYLCCCVAAAVPISGVLRCRNAFGPEFIRHALFIGRFMLRSDCFLSVTYCNSSALPKTSVHSPVVVLSRQSAPCTYCLPF